MAKITFDSSKTNQKDIASVIEELGYLPQLHGEHSTPKDHARSETKNTLLKGITYGLVPHIGCIGFVVASILGVTVAAELFKPLLMSAWFFYALIILSILFATASSVIYLMKNELLSLKGIKKKKVYLATMYGSTIGISLLFLFVVFPMLVSVSYGNEVQSTPNLASGATIAAPQTLDTTTTPENVKTFKMSVQIPCGGHAPLIISEVRKVSGVVSIKNNGGWNVFEVNYDADKTSQEQILGIQVFKSYPAKVL